MNEDKVNVKELCENTISLLKELKDVAGDEHSMISSTIKHVETIIISENLKERYGIEIKPRYIRSEENIFIDGYYEYGNIKIRKLKKGDILNSKKQPNDELLFIFEYPTGAYIFGEKYFPELFKDFFEELKTYNPKYIDKPNSYLYFEMEDGCKLFNEYNAICGKYQDRYYQLKKEEEIKKLKMKLEKLEEELEECLDE